MTKSGPSNDTHSEFVGKITIHGKAQHPAKEGGTQSEWDEMTATGKAQHLVKEGLTQSQWMK